ncbi:MAG: hypothetical protein A3C36_01885 [Omnitrophica WOR_2 bacterium RIFCSPHIGHO2_02_FULL_52_10]|nr:MAG: hypothetical protein A3C36_01885 [Omnitrophica WOR_2 bacterium RIFCSPHIGHO2_02_FULL_52_10]
MIFQLIIVQVITFIGLVLVLRKILITSSFKETRRLQQLNEENALKARELAGKIADADADYRSKMAKADDEIREMKAKAKKEIEQLKETLVSVGKAEGARIVAQALNSKEEIRAEIEEQMRDRSVVFSSKVFTKVLSSDEQRPVFNGLLESVFKELENLDGGQLKKIDLSGPQNGLIEARVSQSMDPKQKEKLEKILTEKFGRDLRVREILDREVISGIIIEIGSFVIDGSLLDRFKKAAASIG